MPYTPVASLSDGDVLYAGFLNQLADNCQFLAGIAGQINIPFVGETTVAGGNFTYKYRIRHLHRFLHIYVAQVASTSDNLDIKYDGTTVYNDGGDRTAPYAWSTHIDLNDTGIISPTPTVGNFYEVYASVTQKTGSGQSTLWFLLESPSTTL